LVDIAQFTCQATALTAWGIRGTFAAERVRSAIGARSNAGGRQYQGVQLVASPRSKRGASVSLLGAVVFLGACASGTGFIPTSPEASAIAVSPTPNPSPTGAEVVLSSGKAVLHGTFTFDFEAGAEAKTNLADVWWEQVDSTRRYLVPQNGARLARMGTVSFEGISRSSLVDLQYTVDKIDGSNASGNQLTAGTVVAVLTRNRHLAKVRIDHYGYDLAISWVTYG
jgi:hypothetical protein